MSVTLRPFIAFALALATLAATLPVAAQAPVTPSFIDETASSGLATSYDGDWFFIVGGGVAAFDCSGDGYADLYLPGGSGTAALYVNTSAKGGSLSFQPQAAGLELDSVTGAYPVDIDSDGITDLVVLRSGENVVMRGLGACKFERANESWGFDGGDAWSTALAATWEKGARWPSVAVGNYVDRYEDISPWGSCTENWLHRGADASFAAPLPLTPSYCALSMLFTDWDRSGTASLRVSNDREYYEGGQEQMWTLHPGEAPALLTEADGWKRLRIWGMGIASYDLDSDGYPEYFLTSMADNKLQKLAAPAAGTKPDYRDVALAAGVTAERPYFGDDRRPSTAWHAQFDDVNNDGLVDLFVAKGNVDQMPDFAMKDPNNLLVQQPDGTFVEAGEVAGIANNGSARGGALVDLNMDGLLDLVVVNRNAGAQVWRNASAETGNWIEFRLKQPAPNLDAIGAWIEVTRGGTVMRRELTVGGGHAGGQLGWVHFGLGDEETTSVGVTWPDGSHGEWTGLAANAAYLLERDQPAAAVTVRQ